MKRRVVNSYSSSKTVINDGKKKKKKRTRRAGKAPRRRTVTPRMSSRASTPRALTPIRTPPSFSSSPRQAYGSPRGSVSLPANLISGSPTATRFSPLYRGSRTPPSLLRKRPRPGRGPAKRRKTAEGQKRPIGPRGRYALAKLASYKNDFPPTRPRTSSPRISPPKRKRKEDRKTMSDLLHYVDLVGRI